MPTQVFLKNKLTSNTQFKGLFHTDKDLRGMSIKPVRPHSGACNVWLRIDLLKEIRGTLSGNQLKFQNPKETASMATSPRTTERSLYGIWPPRVFFVVFFASYLLM